MFFLLVAIIVGSVTLGVHGIQSGWITPHYQENYDLTVDQGLELKTTANVYNTPICVYFNFPYDGDVYYINFKCTDVQCTQWVYVIRNCMTDSWADAQPMTRVPTDQTKIWRITRTQFGLIVVCNHVTVLDFKFATNYLNGFSRCESFWTKESTSIAFNWKDGMYGHDDLLSIRTAGDEIGCWESANRLSKGSGYRGGQSITRTGLSCQKWTSQSPNTHSYTPDKYPDKGIGDHNYCRNPAEKYTDVWCYTDSTDTRWDWCDVPTCEREWITPQFEENYDLTVDQGLELKTTANEYNTPICVYFNFPDDGDVYYINFKCTDDQCTQWVYVIRHCMTDTWADSQPLTRVPTDQTKIWRITRTQSGLKVVCNHVTVLDFKFATNYLNGFTSCQSLWTRESTSIAFNWKDGMYGHNLSIRTAEGEQDSQAGCHVDRCGDHGNCEAVGSSDYTCDCEDNYEFDQHAGTCLPVHSHYRTVYGDKAIGDDAVSTASCNAGEKVMRCHTFGAPSAADGVFIVENAGITSCEARASHSMEFSILAVAYCGADIVTTDPCTQEEIHQIQYRSNTGQSPSVSCPDGYVMENCIFHSPWSQILTDVNKALINSIGAVGISGDGSCSMTDCLQNPEANQWCRLSAVCKKLVGDEYLKAACPTCDNVKCPVGKECKMVGDLPQCVPRIPGGCEVDKCGEGECIEDGADYECECHSGYHFNDETCVDVDECLEDPCGNGECTNTPGSYSCVCDAGYELARGTCEDIDECLDNPCSDTERCSNIEGSYICDCLDTFVKDPVSGDCVCADGFENKDGACVDIDECANSPCGENEDCFNTVGNYNCECSAGFKRGNHGVCQEIPEECDITVQKSKINAFKGTNVNVKLKGESKKTFKKYATITWTKNNDPWNPKDEGKEKMNGFTIRKFDADDAGIYVGSIYIDEKGEISECEVQVEIELLEGSATIAIENEQKLAGPQKAGQPLTIKCDLDLLNVKLKDPKNPDNVNWYKVTDDGDELLDDTDNISIEKGNGTYKLTFSSPTPDDSGTYRCEFDKQGIEASTEVTIEIV